MAYRWRQEHELETAGTSQRRNTDYNSLQKLFNSTRQLNPPAMTSSSPLFHDWKRCVTANVLKSSFQRHHTAGSSLLVNSFSALALQMQVSENWNHFSKTLQLDSIPSFQADQNLSSGFPFLSNSLTVLQSTTILSLVTTTWKVAR